MTFSKLCSYVCVSSLALLVFLLFYFRVQKMRGVSAGKSLPLIIILTILFFASAVALAVMAA